MTDLENLPKHYRPVRKAAQRLRWFISSFEEHASQTSARTSIVYRVDQTILAKVFAGWLRVFQAQKPERDEDKLAYVGFAAGLMLRELVAEKPVSVQDMPRHADLSDPACFWPEGYLYVSFCLQVRGLVVREDFHGEQRRSEELDNIRVWWSFKENVQEDPSMAIAFLELFAGEDPNWRMPSLFRSGRARRIATLPKQPDRVRPT